MRIMVFFDLPMQTNEEIRAYNKFRKTLIKQGYVMMQYSIYTKIVQNKTAADNQVRKISKLFPKNGIGQILIVTEKQFSNMILINNLKHESNIVDTDERLIIL